MPSDHFFNTDVVKEIDNDSELFITGGFMSKFEICLIRRLR